MRQSHHIWPNHNFSEIHFEAKTMYENTACCPCFYPKCKLYVNVKVRAKNTVHLYVDKNSIIIFKLY